MLLQSGWECAGWCPWRAPALRAQAPSGVGWLVLPVASSANTVSYCQSSHHSFPLPLLSRSLSCPCGKETSLLLQQQHKPEGIGESEAVAHASPLPPGSAGLSWECWAALRVSSKAGAMRGAGMGAGSVQQAAGSWPSRRPAFLRAGNPSHASCGVWGAPPPQQRLLPGCMWPWGCSALRTGTGAKRCLVALVLSVDEG